MAVKKARFIALVVLVKSLEEKTCRFFAIYDILDSTGHLLRRLYLEIWQFLCNDNGNDDDKTDYFTPCACEQGNNPLLTRTDG